MVKVHFPTFFMSLLKHTPAQPPNFSRAVFQIPKSMTKTEVKEYLTKIYDMDVKNINTVNFLGTWHTISPNVRFVQHSDKTVNRAMALRKVKAYKRPNTKRAYVSFLEHEYNDMDDEEEIIQSEKV